MFTPLADRASTVDACVRAIEAEILSGRLGAGARLPGERDLATQLGVARLTLRAALARLADAGLIAIRQGAGTVVQDVHRHGSPALLGPIARDAADRGELRALAAELLAIRRGLAGGVLTRLAGRAPTRAALARLDAAIDAFAAAPADPAALAAADHDVVAALVAASRSAVSGLFLNPVFAALAELPALRAAIYARPADNVAGWRALAAWLRTPRRDPTPMLAALAARDDATLARLRPTSRRGR